MIETSEPQCPCSPCIARERERSEQFILDHTPMDAKIGVKFASEFRRIVSIAPQLSFREQLAELEAFNAATESEQWTLLQRYAEDHREAVDEQFRADVEELDEMEALIEAARKHLGLPPAAPQS